MKLTIELSNVTLTTDIPEATAEILDLAVGYYGTDSWEEVVRDAVLAMVATVKEDAIAGPDGQYIGARSEIDEALYRDERQAAFRKRIVGQETQALEAEVARLQAELRERDGDGWKDGDL